MKFIRGFKTRAEADRWCLPTSGRRRIWLKERGFGDRK
jgi:hypothetical protein